MIKFLADYLAIIIVLIGGVSLLWYIRKDRYQTYLRVMMMGLTALVLAKLAAVIFQPNELRPFQALKEAAKATSLNNPGFPSDHVLLIVTITIAVWVTTKNRPLGLLLLVMSIGVGVGRILALVHTPVDVIGGFVIAIIAGSLWYGKSLYSIKNI